MFGPNPTTHGVSAETPCFLPVFRNEKRAQTVDVRNFSRNFELPPDFHRKSGPNSVQCPDLEQIRASIPDFRRKSGPNSVLNPDLHRKSGFPARISIFQKLKFGPKTEHATAAGHFPGRNWRSQLRPQHQRCPKFLLKFRTFKPDFRNENQVQTSTSSGLQARASAQTWPPLGPCLGPNTRDVRNFSRNFGLPARFSE